ncbi:hypothetical protein C8J56DRAFT_1037276 [Mycena floridula]|nr:hypothetical protein C8J56DRAFT_1037276 [Mycena floridula]
MANEAATSSPVSAERVQASPGHVASVDGFGALLGTTVESQNIAASLSLQLRPNPSYLHELSPFARFHRSRSRSHNVAGDSGIIKWAVPPVQAGSTDRFPWSFCLEHGARDPTVVEILQHTLFFVNYDRRPLVIYLRAVDRAGLLGTKPLRSIPKTFFNAANRPFNRWFSRCYSSYAENTISKIAAPNPHQGISRSFKNHRGKRLCHQYKRPRLWRRLIFRLFRRAGIPCQRSSSQFQLIFHACLVLVAPWSCLRSRFWCSLFRDWGMADTARLVKDPSRLLVRTRDSIFIQSIVPSSGISASTSTAGQNVEGVADQKFASEMDFETDEMTSG